MRREVKALLLSTDNEVDDNFRAEEIVRWHLARVTRLGGLREVSEAIGKSRQHTWNLSHQPGFPEPVHVTHATPLWDVEDVKGSQRK